MDLVLLTAALLIGLAIGVATGLALARARAGSAEARATAAEDKLAYAESQLADRFRTLSAEALDESSRRFLELAELRFRSSGAEASGQLEQRKQAIEQLIAPLKETLATLEDRLREAESGRRASQAELAKHVDVVRHSSDQLRKQTSALVNALRRPEARGRWGELQLRRVVEISGMTPYCDFDEQATAHTADGSVRPDLVVRLIGGKNVVVDSKVSLAAYLEAVEEGAEAKDRLDAHARHLREHVDRLASKAYWQAFSPAPEFVVLFIPGEAFLAPALERDPELLEHSLRHRVHIATPTTLVTMLRTAHYAWQQEALSANAQAVFELGRELYDRLGTMGRHVDHLGRSLTGAVAAYNRAVGSLENRVLVSARKLNQLGVTEAGLDQPEAVEESPRALSAAELTDDAEEAGTRIRLLP